ncbi:hypothetical protein AHF37_10447 [Paragonimus kellicotti]|nr:hypothetical protein AHF37_10447 [Paragonimus kellicotti]
MLVRAVRLHTCRSLWKVVMMVILFVATEEPSERVDEDMMLTVAGVTSSVTPATAVPCAVKKSVEDCKSNDMTTSDIRFDVYQLESNLVDAMNRFQSNFHRTMVQFLQLASHCSIQIPVKYQFNEANIKRAESFVGAIDGYEREFHVIMEKILNVVSRFAEQTTSKSV